MWSPVSFRAPRFPHSNPKSLPNMYIYIYYVIICIYRYIYICNYMYIYIHTHLSTGNEFQDSNISKTVVHWLLTWAVTNYKLEDPTTMRELQPQGLNKVKRIQQGLTLTSITTTWHEEAALERYHANSIFKVFWVRFCVLHHSMHTALNTLNAIGGITSMLDS